MNNNSSNFSRPKIYKTIVKSARRETKKLAPDLKEFCRQAEKRILDQDRDGQIILFPYYFHQALQEKYQKLISRKLLIRLGKINLYAWIAYTIFDDIIDHQLPPTWLPAAMTYYHLFLSRLERLNLSRKMREQIKLIVTQAAAGQNQETKKSIDLANRSLFHALGPLIILSRLKQNYNHWLNGCRHYLGARQLCDDALDWEEDAQHGRINFVAQKILADNPSRQKMKITFWRETMAKVNREIINLSDQAETCLKKIEIFAQPKYFLELADKYRRVGEAAEERRLEVANWLTAYQNLGNDKAGLNS